MCLAAIALLIFGAPASKSETARVESLQNQSILYPIFYVEETTAYYLAFYSPDLNQYIHPFQSEPFDLAARRCREEWERYDEAVASEREKSEENILFIPCKQGMTEYISQFTHPEINWKFTILARK